MLSSGTRGFCKTFKSCSCALLASLTVLSKLMYNISEKFSNYLQIPGNSLLQIIGSNTIILIIL